MLLCNTNSEPQREKIYLDVLKNKLSDGVIFLAPELSKDELSDLGKRFPVVQCCEYKEGAKVSHVSIDNREAAYRMVKYLISLGHKRIGMISSSNNYVSTIHREEGYKKALLDSGIEVDMEIIKHGDYSFSSGMTITKQFLCIKERPTAIFAISDMMAIGAVKEIKANGLKVPEDIAVTGFDNIEFANMCEPTLTTVFQYQYELGCTAMDLLLKQICGEIKEPNHGVVNYELIIRESTFK